MAGGRSPSDTPRTWLLASPHAGDNAQLNALAQGLGWPVTTKRLRYSALETLVRLSRWPTLAGLDRKASDQLAPPWPDLLLVSGRPNESVTRWIRKNANPAAKIVFIGTPFSSLDAFDLVITTPQYSLPQRPNVLHLTMPLHTVTSASLAEAKLRWHDRLAHLPKPITTVLVGGSSGPYVFAENAARRLASAINARKGSVLVTTSARTPPEVAGLLRSEIKLPNVIHAWRAVDSDNPFLAFLATADEIIVTADSISMIAEAVATEKPVHLFDIDQGPQAMRAEAGPAQPIHWQGRNVESTLFRLAMRLGPASWSRDLRIVHKAVVNQNLAQWLGDELSGKRAIAPATALQQSVLRVRQLFGL